jgi:tetratricopeptide (TPR) repeat protein
VELRKAVGAMFRGARERQGLTQYQLADLTDTGVARVSRGAIAGIERGECFPGLEALVALSRVLHLDAADVIERVDLGLTVPVDLTGLSLEELRADAERQFWAGDHRRAMASYDAMLQLVALAPPRDATERSRTLARIEINRAVALRQCSALGAAEAAAKRAIALGQSCDDLQAEACMVLASIHSHEGNFPLAEMLAERAVQLAGRCDQAARGLAWCQKGAVLHRAGRLDEALAAYARAREASAGARDARNLIVVEGSVGSCYFDLGRKGLARRQFIKAIELARKHHDPAAEASRLVELGRLSLSEGDADQAETLGRSALRISRSAATALTAFRAEWLLHLVAAARSPTTRDRHRVAHLKKLYVQVKGHRTADAVLEFERDVLAARTAGETEHE